MKVEKNKISRTYLGEIAKLTEGEYTSIKQILDEIRLKTELEKLDYIKDPITKHLFNKAALLGRYNFSSPQIPSLLGFTGVRDRTGYHIGYKQGSSKHSPFTIQDLVADYPVDACVGTQLMFIYLDIIHYQIVGYKVRIELLFQAAPELIEVATKRKSSKQALKSTVRKTIKNASRRRKLISKKSSKKNNRGETKNKTRHSQKTNCTEKSLRFLYKG